MTSSAQRLDRIWIPAPCQDLVHIPGNDKGPCGGDDGRLGVVEARVEAGGRESERGLGLVLRFKPILM